MIYKVNNENNKNTRIFIMCVDIAEAQSFCKDPDALHLPENSRFRVLDEPAMVARRQTGVTSMQEKAKALVLRIAKGDRAAEGELVSLCEPGLKRVLRGRTDTRQDLEDLLNEVWIRALPKLRKGDIDNTSAVQGYLNGFARGVAANLLKSAPYKASKSKVAEPELFWPELYEPFKLLSEQQVLEIVDQLMDELPSPRDRDLLRRFLVYEEDKEALCKEYNLSDNAFRSVLSRARAKLRELASSYLDES